MPKNIVVCCDGTANEFAQNITNVVRLFSTLIHDPARQVAFYHPGLGTMEAPGALTPWTRWFTQLLGQAFGYGLKSDIQNAYIFLMYNFEPGDCLFLVGFSRGAYTVRALASLLKMYGLIQRGNETLVPYALRMLMAIQKARRQGDAQSEAMRTVFELAARFKETFSSTDCRPHFVGLWDTVSSVGWYNNPLRLPYTAGNSDIAISRHAVAIDERRAFFRTNLWMPKPDPPEEDGPRDLLQVWFAGVHADIGGGYPEKDSGLAKITLEWMLREAVAAGLLVDAAKVERVLGKGDPNLAEPCPNAVMHQSLRGAWWIAEYLPKPHYNWQTKQWERRMNMGRPRTIPQGSLIHASVYARRGYAPPLPADAVKVA
jgi:uncharacterized protein (DUF2235 family)